MTAAMQNISHFLGIVNMTERNTIGVMSKANHVYRLLDVFQCLVLFPMFGIRNIYRGHLDNIIATFMEARKDVFYRLMDNPEVDWRRSMWHISLRLWKSIRLRSDHRENDVCVIFDDTDHEKTGRCIEKIGRVHSHLAHRAVLGFKCLCMAVTDGVSELLLDLELLGEKGKKGNYGMSEGELSRRHVSTRTSDLLESRKKAYDTSKIALVKEMTRRAVSKGLRFSYALGDSWFTCKEIVRFFADRRRRPHWLGMIKVGEKSRTRYHLGDKALTAPELVNLGKKQGKKKYSRKLGCSYIVHDVMFAGVAVRIFLTKRTKHGKWNGLLSTDTALDFFKAWEIYCRRWSLEVGFYAKLALMESKDSVLAA